MDLFEKEEAATIFRVVKKIPYHFFYVFETDDGIRRTMMIEDWEIGMLYLNALESAAGDEAVACQKVKEKYFYINRTTKQELFLKTLNILRF